MTDALQRVDVLVGGDALMGEDQVFAKGHACRLVGRGDYDIVGTVVVEVVDGDSVAHRDHENDCVGTDCDVTAGGVDGDVTLGSEEDAALLEGDGVSVSLE